MGIRSQYQNINLSTADATRTPSAGLWHEVDADMARRGLWCEDWNDFDTNPGATTAVPTSVAPYFKGLVFTASGGTFTRVDTEGGVVNVGSDGDNEQASFSQGTEPFKIIQGAGELIFECRFKTSTIANTKHGIFIGMMEAHSQTATVPIADDGTLADANYVGFLRLEADGDKLDTIYRANGVGSTFVTVKADAITLVADTWIKVGMSFNRDGNNKFIFYENGIELPDTKAIPSAAGTDFPNDVRMGVAFAVSNATGSTPGNAELDWMRCAQKTIDET